MMDGAYVVKIHIPVLALFSIPFLRQRTSSIHAISIGSMHLYAETWFFVAKVLSSAQMKRFSQ